MDIDMETSPTNIDPNDLSTRERFRRYGKRPSNSILSPNQDSSASRLGEIRSNVALYLENFKHEAESLNSDHGRTPSNTHTASKRRTSIDSHGISERDFGLDSIRRTGVHSLNVTKIEDDVVDTADTTFSLFASILDSAVQGLMSIPDLILQFESSCRSVSESVRYGSTERHRIVEDKLMRQKAKLLLDEAASWSLIWHLYGKGNEDIPSDLLMFPTTSHLEACEYVVENHTAQLCLRIVQWLEELASKSLDLDNKVCGSHVGTYLPTSGIWHHTQRLLKKGASVPKTVHHLDFDAPTREHAQQLPDDKKQDESLLEDVWTLMRAGRLEEACNLCRSAGQPWRAATLCPFGGFDNFPSVKALIKNGRNRTLQAIELESGCGHQWRLWKWASYCASEPLCYNRDKATNSLAPPYPGYIEKIAEQDGAKYESAVYAAQCSNLKRILPICTDWESACWAMAKSWLDAQVDRELVRLQPQGMDKLKELEEAIERGPENGNATKAGPDHWPLQVLNQQPRDLSALLQKLHSSDTVPELVTRACKEQQRQIEMSLMLGDIPSLMDLIWSWISPSENDEKLFRPHGDPQMMRFGAHLVLVLRYLLADQMKKTFQDTIMTLGDRILNMYAMYLFTTQHEELVGIYASQLANHRCIDLFVHMMELRLNSSVHVKYKIFLSAIEYLPFSPGDGSKASYEDIIERVLSRSRETKSVKYDHSSYVAEEYRLQSLQKSMVVQWLCFTPPSTINDAKDVTAKLLIHALMHSNVLFREFALISMWRVPAMPIGAHTLLSFLAEPLKAEDTILSIEDPDVSENLREFQDWSEYYSCDAKFRKWLTIELENAEVSPVELSLEEKKSAISAAQETLGASLTLLQREDPWLTPTQDRIYESGEQVYLELHATAILCLASGECLSPDANLCTALTSALYSSVSEEDVLERQLMVNVSRSLKDTFSIEVVLRGKAIEGDGLGTHDLNDGGILASVIAAGFKGELAKFQDRVTLEISRLDAWYLSAEGSQEGSATYIVRGLCRRCCIPEVVLRCMQVSDFLVKYGYLHEEHDELIDIAANPELNFINLFSQQQLQEFLLLEREYTIHQMELQEANST